MINKIREQMKKEYEANNNKLNYLYRKAVLLLWLSKKLKPLKEEMKSVMATHLKDKTVTKEELKKIKKEIILFRLIYKVRPGEYFLFETTRRTPKEREGYITREMTNGYYKKINNFSALKILNDKYLSYKVFKDLYNRDVLYVSSEEDKENVIDFVSKHKKFVLKPAGGYGGVGIEFLKTSDFESKDALFDHTIPAMPYILEEIVQQHDSISAFHKGSLNTMRVVTFQYEGKVSIVWAFFRVGQGNATVDNMTSGGLGAQIDPETGVILTDAIDYLGSKVEKHPDSHIKFKGFQIPDWDELKKTLIKLSSKIPSVHCIGWDMAYSKKGWVLVEANGRAQVVTIQVLTGHGFRGEFEKMASLINYDNSNINLKESEEM